MFLTKSPKSFLSFSQYLLVMSWLFTFSLSYKCVDKSKLSGEDQTLIDSLLALYGQKQNLISVGHFGKMYIYPTDATKVVKIQKIPKRHNYVLNGMDATLALSNRDTQLNGNPRVTPNLVKSFCINLKDEVKLVIYVFERFRDNLVKATTRDQRFIGAMVHFSDRMKFYGEMMSSFGEIAKLKYKHCEIIPENFLYKDANVDWGTDYFKTKEPPSFYPVISNFGLTVGWGSHCKGGNPQFTDLEDYKNDIKFFDKEKAKVELYSMALVILYLENNILQKLASTESLTEDATNKLADLSGFSDLLWDKLDENLYPYTNNSLPVVFKGLLALLSDWNTETIEYDHVWFKKDLEFIISGMDVYNEFLLRTKGASEEQIYNMRLQYQEFTNTLISMAMKNNVTMDKRPSSDEVIQKFTQVKTASLAIEQTIGQRRSLVLI